MTTPQVIVSTKSAWLSKTNWAAAATGAAAVITQFMPFIPTDYQGKATALVALLGAVAVWVTKTFYSTTISPASLPVNLPVSQVTHDAGTTNETTADVLNATELARLKK